MGTAPKRMTPTAPPSGSCCWVRCLRPHETEVLNQHPVGEAQDRPGDHTYEHEPGRAARKSTPIAAKATTTKRFTPHPWAASNLAKSARSRARRHRLLSRACYRRGPGRGPQGRLYQRGGRIARFPRDRELRPHIPPARFSAGRSSDLWLRPPVGWTSQRCGGSNR